MIDFLVKVMERQGDAPAVAEGPVSAGGVSSYASLLERLSAWRGRLSEAAIGCGSVVSLEAEYGAESIAAFLALTETGAIVVPLSLVLFGVDVVAVAPGLLLIIGLGSIGLAAVGTLYAGLTVRLRAREVLLPLLLLPVVAPLLLAAVRATATLLAGDPFGELFAWLQLLAGYDVAMLLAGGLTYGLALEE